jgi:polyferredoxin
MFNLELWAFEIYFLALLLMVAASALFFITSYFGRLWCGFACPQTIWIDLFNMVERAIEGDRNKKLARDKKKPSTSWVMRKLAKHIIWLAIAILTGGAWIFYYNDAPSSFMNIIMGQASFKQYFFMGLFASTTYIFAGFAKEKLCIYMCPWPKFQAAMLDGESLTVTYQTHIGEPRGSRKLSNKQPELGIKELDGKPLPATKLPDEEYTSQAKYNPQTKSQGQCIDCGLCVAVCPMGVDIRDGFQIGCINCGLCIDACNNIMEKIGSPKFLINFDKANNQDIFLENSPYGDVNNGNNSSNSSSSNEADIRNNYEGADATSPFHIHSKQKRRHRVKIFRLKPVIYAVMMIFTLSATLLLLHIRPSTKIHIEKIHTPLYSMLKDGKIRNSYRLKILNKLPYNSQYIIQASDGRNMPKQIKGKNNLSYGNEISQEITAREMKNIQIFIKQEKNTADRQIFFTITNENTGEKNIIKSVFFAPH